MYLHSCEEFVRLRMRFDVRSSAWLETWCCLGCRCRWVWLDEPSELLVSEALNLAALLDGVPVLLLLLAPLLASLGRLFLRRWLLRVRCGGLEAGSDVLTAGSVMERMKRQIDGHSQPAIHFLSPKSANSS